MTNEFEKRAAARIEHISPLRVKNLQSGQIYEARMVNFSASGICFGSDGFFEKGAKMYLCLQHSPYSPSSGVLEYYNGEVMWRKESKRSLFKYEYGIELVSDSSKQDSSSQTAKKVNASRRHPRKPFSHKIRFGTHKGLFDGTTKNISSSGVFIATEEKLEVGQVLKLSLPTEKGTTYEIKGQIVWVNKEGFGLEFLADQPC